MRALNSAPEIIAMANGLKLVPGDPVPEILRYCKNRIRGWLLEHSRIRTISDLEQIVCEELNLTIHEIWSDGDLEKLVRDYVEEGDTGFSLLRADMDENTYATLMRRRKANPCLPTAYVAIIDCRGEKRHRKFFSRWHEIAHLLTLYTQLDLPFHRSTTEKNATEKMMDLIAGEVGFLEELFRPLLEAELEEMKRLTFAGVDRVRSAFCSDASFQATLHACVNNTQKPMVLLELGLAFKQCELRIMAVEPRSSAITLPAAQTRQLHPGQLPRHSYSLTIIH